MKMENVVLVAENERACKLLDCLVAYKKLVGVKKAPKASVKTHKRRK